MMNYILKSQKEIFLYFNSVTREDFERTGRITTWIDDNKLTNYLNIENFDPKLDRVMICGSEDMTFDLKKLFEKKGSSEVQHKYKVDS